VRRFVTPAPVPLSGFLNLSAVSWQVRASRPCLMPQPFLGSPLQSLPLVEIAYPSRGSLASLQSSTNVRRRAPDALSPLVSPTPARERVRLDPPTTMSSLSSSRSSSPGRSGCRTAGSSRPASFTYFEASLPLRVRSLLVRVSPRQQVAALLGFFPSRVFSKRASESAAPPGPEDPSTSVRPKAPARGRQGRNPADQERPHQLPRKSGSTCSTASSPLRDWPAPPLDGAPPLMTLGLRAHPTSLAYRVS